MIHEGILVIPYGFPAVHDFAIRFSDRTLLLRHPKSGKCDHSGNAKWFAVALPVCK